MGFPADSEATFVDSPQSTHDKCCMRFDYRRNLSYCFVMSRFLRAIRLFLTRACNKFAFRKIFLPIKASESRSLTRSEIGDVEDSPSAIILA